MPYNPTLDKKLQHLGLGLRRAAKRVVSAGKDFCEHTAKEVAENHTHHLPLITMTSSLLGLRTCIYRVSDLAAATV